MSAENAVSDFVKDTTDKLSNLSLGTHDRSAKENIRPQQRYKPDSQAGQPVKTARSSIINATDTVSNMPVILKRIPDAKTADHELTILRRIKQEKVPHSLQYLDSYVDGSETVLVFPRLRRLETRNLDLVVVARYAKQLAEILTRIHKIKLAHNEIALSNLMSEDGSSLVLISWSHAKFSAAAAANPLTIITPVDAEVAAASAPRSFTAPDIHAAGNILGQWLEPYLPGCSLNYLGSRLVRKSTTTYIARKLIDRLDAQRMGHGTPWHVAVSHAADLLSRMLEPDEEVVITAQEMLRHPFVTADEEDFAGTDFESYRKELALVGLRGATRSTVGREPRIFMRG